MIGAKIRDLRKKLGMTQEQLAGPNLTKSYISQVELGRIHPSPKALEAIAARLGKPVGFFLERSDDLRTIQVLMKAAYALCTTGRVDDGMVGLKEALALAERTGRDDVVARIKVAIGQAELSRGNPQAAVPWLKESLVLILPAEDGEAALAAATALGYAFIAAGAFAEAADALGQARKWATDLDCHSAWKGVALKANGDFWAHLNQWAAALEFYRQALGMPDTLLSPAERGALLARAAHAHSRLDQAEQAHQHLEQSLRLSAAADRVAQAEIRAELGAVCLKLHRWDTAGSLLEESWGVLGDLGYAHPAQPEVIRLLLLWADAADRPDRLRAYADQAETDAPPWRSARATARFLLAVDASRLGQWDDAHRLFRSAWELAEAGERSVMAALSWLWEAVTDPPGERVAWWSHARRWARPLWPTYPIANRLPLLAPEAVAPTP